MSNKQSIINIIDTVPQSVIDEIYHYALFLKLQIEKEARNAEYVEKILEGKKQCAEGRGIRRDIVEFSEYE